MIRTRHKRSNRTLLLMLELIAALIVLLLLLPSCVRRATAASATACDAVTSASSAPGSSRPADEGPALAADVAAGDTAPDFTVELFDGTRLALSSLRGKVVLLNFWATWCPPCRAELARVQHEIIDRFAGRDFVFLPVSRGESREAVAAFREKTGYAFPMGLDPDRTIFDRYAPTTIPRNYLIGRDGKVLVAAQGYSPEEFDALIRAVDQATRR